MADTVIPKTSVFCDLSSGYFVTGRTSLVRTLVPLGQFFSQNKLNLEIYPLVQNPSAIPTGDPFHQVDVSGLSVVFSILDSTGATVLASQSTFTADVTRGTLTGILDCNTANMVMAVTAGDAQVIIEVRFTDSSTVSKNVRASGSSTIVRKQFNVSGSPTPVGADVYLTDKQTLALFVPRTGSEGDNFSMLSGGQRYLVYIDATDLTLKASPVS